MTVRQGLFLLTGVLMGGTVADGQSLMDPRAIGLGSYIPEVRDSRGFSWNPAGLLHIRDWDFSMTTYSGVRADNAGFVFHGLTLGKRFLENEAVGFEYTPGTHLRLVVPPTLSVGQDNVPASNDREMDYSESGVIGFAHRFSSTLALGLAARYRSEQITDTRISLVERDSIPLVPVSEQHEEEGRAWFVDAGAEWQPLPTLTVGVTGRNLFGLFRTTLPESLQTYALPHAPIGSLATSYAVSQKLRLSVSGSSNGTGAIGHEWTPGLGLAFRNALYFDRHESPVVAAFSVGVGWSYQFAELGASYLHFSDRSHHSGTVALGEFDPSAVQLLDLNPYVRDRASLSVKVIFGNVREKLAEIERVEMFGSVYPSSFEIFAYRPIGKAFVRNISTKRIQAHVSFFVDKFMDAPTESQAVTIEPGGRAQIDLMAVFNDHVKSVASMMIRDADVYVSAVPAEKYDDRAQTRVLFRGRNDWDGTAASLRFFVQPDDPEVLRVSRDLLLQSRSALSSETRELAPFQNARVLINGFAGKITYVADPKLTADFVQYPAETLKRHGGDCDDMTVCFSSLLSSIGISTAFIDVVPPDAPDKSHIYLLFDTGLSPRFGSAISENPKRYVIRREKNGAETIWIPIETTVIARGFDDAWTTGAQEYFDDVEVALGLAKGWVHILDVN